MESIADIINRHTNRLCSISDIKLIHEDLQNIYYEDVLKGYDKSFYSWLSDNKNHKDLKEDIEMYLKFWLC